MSDIKKTETLDKQVEQVVDLYGAQLGAYLEMWDVPTSFKEAIVDELPRLTLAEVDHIKQIIEEHVSFQVGIEMTPEYQEQAVVINDRTMKELDEIMNSVNA